MQAGEEPVGGEVPEQGFADGCRSTRPVALAATEVDPAGVRAAGLLAHGTTLASRTRAVSGASLQ